jgi:putative ABC transport system permease protein
VQVRDPSTGAEFAIKIIGVLDQGPLFATGIFFSQETWAAATGQIAPPTTHFIRLADGVDAKEAARALESAFLEHGMDAVSIVSQIQEQRGLNDAMMGLVQAFMGLGLVVGIAALGVISTRAVVERRHQIGMLRAIGFRRRMIQRSFLLESSFVALLGILIGLILGLILSYNFYNGEVAAIASETELSFEIPWGRLSLIVAIAYGASLLTTYLPSWQAARVYPAEALRYE